ncbi:MAG TPA: hypothetical protein VNN07_00160 [Candidatus Tectomicrobia bacterium]|nr:hypothetical protein [Candidatus Tectomicrobia bacterium]
MRSREQGAALFEVLAAIVILGLSGLALVELVSVGARAEVSAARREREVADAERLLAAYTLLTRVDLDRRLGRREVGPYVVEVQRPERGLYRIAVARGEAPEMEEVVTVVWRRDADSAP